MHEASTALDRTAGIAQDCPLCGAGPAAPYGQDRRRAYFRCGRCWLIFVPSAYFISSSAEKERYDLHRNDPADPGYREHLARLFRPLHEALVPGCSGLDFGSGPVPLLSRMFEEAGHRMALYDPFYAPAPAALEAVYDFICAAEVVEHLRDPGPELERLWTCLRPGGLLGVLTAFAVRPDAFARWHYKNDPTHIRFFDAGTMHWLAEHWGAVLSLPGDGVAVFRKEKTVGAGPAARYDVRSTKPSGSP